MFLGELQQPVNRLSGIGPRHHKSLSNGGVFSIGQLLSYYPSKYEDHKTICPILEAAGVAPANDLFTIVGHQNFLMKGKPTLKIFVEDSQGTQGTLLCFGRSYLKDKLVEGAQIFLYASFQFAFGEWSTGRFDYEFFSPNPIKFGKIIPLYPLMGSLSQKVLQKAIFQGLKEYARSINNEIPPYITKEYYLLSKKEALWEIHFPSNFELLDKAKKSLIYEEFFHLQTAVGKNALKLRGSVEKGGCSTKGVLEKQLRDSLPFSLTEDQNKVLKEISEDLNSKRPMIRLIQGDVGSGKTLVAFIAALNVIEMGKQVAIMAPTELLARQHAQSALKLMKDMNIGVAFLSGNIQAEGRRQLLKQLKEGGIHLIIGTHALFTDDVDYANLGLVIIDEQHRFGVAQRQALAQKGENPDLLFMTATPIPRTLAMTAFGDLDVSTIKTMPQGRLPIITHLAKEGHEQKVYNFVGQELDKGRQAYFVYPLIEQSDKLNLKDAENMFQNLAQVFPQFRATLIHSRIPEDEKRIRMERFSKGEVQILVATSVVEVGVDVPNATVIVIEHAERFGLSALHQLRGRVGRSDLQSYALLVYSTNLTEDGKQRLRIMKENTDGFTISEEDLKLRGPGEMTGVKQSGYMKLRIADMTRDADILVRARHDVKLMFERDPQLKEEAHSITRKLWQTVPPFSETLIRTG